MSVLGKRRPMRGQFSPPPEYVLPLDKFLGPRTLSMVKSLRKAKAAILRRPTRAADDTPWQSRRLTSWRAVTANQVATLGQILRDAKSYWNGWPMFRRLPPRPDFVLDVAGADSSAILLVDLPNPGWVWSCADEQYWGFHFAGEAIAALAKSVFPEYASADPRASNGDAITSRGASNVHPEMIASPFAFPPDENARQSPVTGYGPAANVRS
jgi:hypothetical protein